MRDSGRSRLAGADDALATIADGAVVGIGGSITASHPMTLVRGLARRGARDLTIVSPTAGLELDLLIAAGCVTRVISCYVGGEGLAAVAPIFRRAVERGEVEIEDLDEAHCAMGLRAAGQRLPFLPWRGGVGTSYPQLNPNLIEFNDPVRGEPLLAVPALELDVALLHAEVADEYGTTQTAGTGYMDVLLGNAARGRVVVQADRIVTNEAICQSPERNTFWREASVVHAPFGAHPTSTGSMLADTEHLRAFVDAGREGGAALEQYMSRYVHDAPDHDTYLEAIGIRRITSLLI